MINCVFLQISWTIKKVIGLMFAWLAMATIMPTAFISNCLANATTSIQILTLFIEKILKLSEALLK